MEKFLVHFLVHEIRAFRTKSKYKTIISIITIICSEHQFQITVQKTTKKKNKHGKRKHIKPFFPTQNKFPKKFHHLSMKISNKQVLIRRVLGFFAATVSP